MANKNEKTQRTRFFLSKIQAQLDAWDYDRADSSEHNILIFNKLIQAVTATDKHLHNVTLQSELEHPDRVVQEKAAREIELKNRVVKIMKMITFNEHVPQQNWCDAKYRYYFEREIWEIISRPDNNIPHEAELSLQLNDVKKRGLEMEEQFCRRIAEHVYQWRHAEIERTILATRTTYKVNPKSTLGKKQESMYTPFDVEKASPMEKISYMFDLRKQHYPQVLKEPTRSQLLYRYQLMVGDSITFAEADLLIRGEVLPAAFFADDSVHHLKNIRRLYGINRKEHSNRKCELLKHKCYVEVPVDDGMMPRFKVQLD